MKPGRRADLAAGLLLLALGVSRSARSANGSLILDLNDDGVQTWDASDAVPFDLDGDGRAERTAWPQGDTDEGFLWIDLNHNGRPDSGRELFGTAAYLDRGQKARDGFEALGLYDTPDYGGNGDGVISGADLAFWDLRLWVDANRDGVAQEGETFPLAARGIVQLNLTYRVLGKNDPAGNLHYGIGTFERWVVRRFGPAYRRVQEVHEVYFREAE